MSLSIQVFTLNCGNGSLGSKTAIDLVQAFGRSRADLMVLNCQEVDFNQLEQELMDAIGTELPFKLKCSSTMATHTKLRTQFHHQTGMMTAILYKPEVSIDDSMHSKQIRRSAKRAGSSFNKGGMLTRFMASKGGENYTIDSITAHLDAFRTVARTLDWANVHGLQEHTVDDWGALCGALPDILMSGYDANTRNTLNGEQGIKISKCAWMSPLQPDMHGLVMAPLGNFRMSRPSTYHFGDVLNLPDKKRMGCAKGGMLDIVAFMDKSKAIQQLGDTSQSALLVEMTDSYFSPIAGAARNHMVIGSALIDVQHNKNTFDRVREHIGCALVGAAPQLASYLLDDIFTESEERQHYLLAVYQCYLSPTGLLQKHLQLHAEKLQYFIELQMRLKPDLMADYQQKLFNEAKPWCTTPGEDAPHMLNDLRQLLMKQGIAFELEKMQLQFLRQAASDKERNLIFHIVQNMMNYLPQLLSGEVQKQVLVDINQLLSFNQVTQAYGRHLSKVKSSESSDTSITGSLLKQKHEIIDLLKAKLGEKLPSSEILNNLRKQLKTDKQILSKHRDDGWLYTLLRTLWGILSCNTVMRQGTSQGGFFAQQAAVIINIPADGEPKIARPL